MPSNRFFTPARSAMAPRIGESTAMIARPMVVASARRWVAWAGARSAAATLAK